jgi:FkbM family methyltransferase
MTDGSADLNTFIEDIAPFFYRRHLTYVDVGAFRGEVLASIMAGGLAVREAHLLEPNSESLERAKALLQKGFRGKSLNFYNLAAGAHAGRIRLRVAKDMTQVLALDDMDPTIAESSSNLVEVDCVTLDQFSEYVSERRISLLKVDVEGFEEEVLKGARGLLERQQIDVIYIEAGMNPAGTQQCYYRTIEDLLNAAHYKLFRIYEQKNEWLDDSPLLRRVNMAFMSQAFADRNPARLTRELLTAQRSLESAETRLAAETQRSASIAAQLETDRKQLTAATEERSRLTADMTSLVGQQQALKDQAKDLQQRLQAMERGNERLALEASTLRQRCDQSSSEQQRLTAATDQMAAELRVVRDQLARSLQQAGELSAQLTQTERRRRSLQETVSEVFSAIGDMHRRHLGQVAEFDDVRGMLGRIHASRPYRFARILASRSRSWRDLFAVPRAIWLARKSLPAPALPLVTHAIRFDADTPSIVFPLSVKPQLVVLPASASRYEVWATLVGSTHSGRVTLELKSVVDGAGAMPSKGVQPRIEWAGLESQAPDADVLGEQPRGLSLGLDAPALLLRVPELEHSVLLSTRRARGDLCLLRLELRHPEGQDARADEVAAPKTVQFSSPELELKLWGGYAEYALATLEERKRLKRVGLSARESAAWSLVRWHYVHEDYPRAMENIEFTRSMVKNPHRRLALAEAQCLIHLGRPEEADACLAHALRTWPEKEFDHLLLRSTVIRMLELKHGAALELAEAKQLEAINELYNRVGMTPITKRDPAQPLTISNIISEATAKPGDQEKKVSVIVPAFNAQASIEWVIDGLVRQTWRNLEIIVVDDLSSDATCAIVEQMAARDPRIRLIRKSVNEGAYATRNAGAREATGHYITVHDSDDWSHPQKIEMQVQELAAQPEKVAVTSHWVRVGDSLDIVGPWVPRGSLFDVNFSSLLFERRLLETMGPWDAVKISGDAEFFYRMRALYGEDCVLKLSSRYLLSLSLAREDSLTRSKATHLRSLFYGLRWNYRDAYLAWSSCLRPGDDPLVVDADSGRRRFPVPLGCRPNRTESKPYDLVVISDFGELEEPAAAAMACIEAACREGQRTAVFHWRKYERPARVPLRPAFYSVVLENDSDILSPGDQIVADLVMVFDASILDHRIDPVPSIECRRAAIVLDEWPGDGRIDGSSAFDPGLAQTHLETAFGVPATWVPADPAIAARMHGDKRFHRQAERPWLPLVDFEYWRDIPLAWQGANRRQPIIGWHEFDGAAAQPTRLYAQRPDWAIRPWYFAQLQEAGAAPLSPVPPPSSQRVRYADFVGQVDFCVFQPMPGAAVRGSQHVAAAFAAGRPVIMSRRYEPIYGDAAVYAEPEELGPLIDRLWASESAYLAAATRAREFARDACSMAGFPQRVAAIAATRAHQTA